MKCELNLELLSKSCAVIMHANTCLHLSRLFLTSQGILHQSSCPYMPQQNGVAERKNRHLVETARTMLLHHNVPSQFWGDAILTACYLINRMPSTVLHNKVPHSLLFPFVYSVVPTLYIISHLEKISWQQNLSSLSFWDILDCKKATAATLPI